MQTVTYTLPGLSAPVEILVDNYGVPHIYAGSSDDVFLTQGFNAARERMWQIDFWRRRGLGRISAVLGRDYVAHDRAARLFMFRGDVDREWASYDDETREACERFVAGINAWIALCRERPELLSPEFSALGYEPEEWEPEDVVRIRNHGVYTNLADEVMRGITLREFGPEVDDIRISRDPFKKIEIPEGLDLDALSEEILAAYGLATLPPSFQKKPPTAQEGSNNWVLSSERTATGRPILANDPHRDTTALPGMRYIAHLSCPEFDVIGAGEPQIPGVSIGHNGTAAFGFTVFITDQEDLYVYELHPDDPMKYRFGDAWEEFELVREQVPLPDGEEQAVELLFSKHGPILHRDIDKGHAFAARVAWLEPGTAPYVGSLGYMKAKNWEDFVAALDRWGTPGENLLYADVNGNIGWKPAALVPVRPNWDGALPVPGDGRYEWDGFYPVSDLPVEFNPERGWIATANEFRFDDDHPLRDQVGYLWATPERRQRIDEVLTGLDRATPEELFDLQLDTVSIHARDLLNTLASVLGDEVSAVEGLQQLLSWDHRMDAGSREALVYEIWFQRHLRPALLQQFLSGLEKPIERETVAPLFAKRLLDDPRIEIRWIREPEQLGLGRDDLLRLVKDTLSSAYDELRRWLGPEEDDPWHWGRLSNAMATHPLRALLSSKMPDEQLRAGPLPRGGSFHTVGLSSYDESFRQVMGSTVRFVFDVGEWDQSLAMNAPGQSGDPRSPHYAHLFSDWVEGKPFPLLYSRERVESELHSIIKLVPEAG